MKKMMFLMLTLFFLGVASMNAQVRIGGTMDPDPSAALDVNKTDDPAPAGNLGLGLPRVNLTSATQQLATGKTPKAGTMIYNTSTSLDGVGVYYWATTAWVKLSSGTGPDLSGYAPKASPALTGTPTTPTATAGTNTTQIASTAFVTAAVAAKADNKGISQLTGDVTAPSTTDGSAAATLATVNSAPGKYGAETAGKTLAYGGTFSVPTVTVNAKGLATTGASYTMTMPAAPTSVTGNAGTATALATGRTIALTGDATGTSAAFNGTANASIPVTLAAITQSNTTSTQAPAAGSTIAVIDAVSRDTKGRVTGVNTKTVTMPAAPDLSGYAPKASPALTGTPTAPTAAAGTNTTQIASTAFVTAAVAAKADNKGISQLTGDVTAPSTTDGSAVATLANSGVTAGTYGQTGNSQTLSPGSTFVVPRITVDAKGRTTSATSVSLTLPTTVGWNVSLPAIAQATSALVDFTYPSGCNGNNTICTGATGSAGAMVVVEISQNSNGQLRVANYGNVNLGSGFISHCRCWY